MGYFLIKVVGIALLWLLIMVAIIWSVINSQ